MEQAPNPLIETIEAGIAAFIERETPKTLLPDPDGCVARAQIAAVPAMARWRAAEINRSGLDLNMLANAQVMVCAAIIANQAMALGEVTINSQFKTVNNMLRAIGEEVGQILTRHAAGNLDRG